MKSAIYPGSFDPVTLGHLDIIKRAAKVCDVLYVAVLNNNHKTPLFSADDRVKMLQDVTSDLANVKVVSFSGLLVDFCKQIDCQTIIRGLRAVTDFEYEIAMAQTNHAQAPDIDTVFFTTSIKYSYLSSSMVKEIAMYGGDINKFIPAKIIDKVADKYKELSSVNQ